MSTVHACHLQKDLKVLFDLQNFRIRRREMLLMMLLHRLTRSPRTLSFG